MRISKTSTTGNIKARKRSDFYPSLEIRKTFVYLREMLSGYARNLHVKLDNDEHYELWTNQGFRTSTTYPRNKKGIQFAAVIIYRNYVGFYFLPLYVDEHVQSFLTTRLNACRKGVSCFHFKLIEEGVVADLDAMISAGWEAYKARRLVL